MVVRVKYLLTLWVIMVGYNVGDVLIMKERVIRGESIEKVVTETEEKMDLYMSKCSTSEAPYFPKQKRSYV